MGSCEPAKFAPTFRDDPADIDLDPWQADRPNNNDPGPILRTDNDHPRPIFWIDQDESRQAWAMACEKLDETARHHAGADAIPPRCDGPGRTRFQTAPFDFAGQHE